MFERWIDVRDVFEALWNGEVIARYEDDRPIPSRLLLRWIRGRPLHVVAADDDENGITFVISTYRPDPDLWTADFRRRR